MIYALKGAKMHLLWLDVPTSITGGNAIGWRLIINTNKYRFSCSIRGGGWVWIRNRVLRILRWRQREILGYMGAPQPEEEENRKGALIEHCSTISSFARTCEETYFKNILPGNQPLLPRGVGETSFSGCIWRRPRERLERRKNWKKQIM